MILLSMAEPGNGGGAGGPSGQGAQDTASLLWADKYRPRGFMDLLSDTVSDKGCLYP